MDLRNDLDFSLAKFLYFFAGDDEFKRLWNLSSENLGHRLKYAYDNQILTRKDMQVLEIVNEKIMYTDYSDSDFYVKKMNKITEIILGIKRNFVITAIKTGDEFNFLNAFEVEMNEFIKNVGFFIEDKELNIHIAIQMWNDFDVMVNTYLNLDILNNSLEFEICDFLGILYYEPLIHWPILEEWLNSKCCPKEYIRKFSVRANPIYVTNVMQNNPDIDINDMLKHIGVI